MFKLKLTVHGDRADSVEELLLELGALSTSLEDAGDHALLEPLPGETPVWPEVTVGGLFGAELDAEAMVHALSERLGIPPGAITREHVEDRDWVRAWMEDFRPMRFGERLWIVPTGYAPPDPQAVNLLLDPGLAFGTGTHPTTALCLEWLDAHPPTDATVIDYGCGSGVLAIAALKLGAHHCIGVDLDPQALTATRENARRNDIADERLPVCLPDDLRTEPVDLVMANILSGPLVALAPALSALVRPGGRLILSGLLEAQAETVTGAYSGTFRMAPPSLKEGWALLAGTRCRPAGPGQSYPGGSEA
ncbi:ribosomal protein L11 methyltransferase [Thioalkalivibrio denitrificans]|uniref:Ribosomal protein L11 methyltransferase n=1 Tax=Thioalkalivibrio denitrificans TaxID=108003 RepID=A0A1V3NDR7_9GAMM|nr:50S ribosomal protein L11 methyltransferase [Thioalkalivibrio denitrificans]OOG23200.1 ribosomal protein L11 methyltransferase [Thioalkalivibrio denitrificans]